MFHITHCTHWLWLPQSHGQFSYIRYAWSVCNVCGVRFELTIRWCRANSVLLLHTPHIMMVYMLMLTNYGFSFCINTVMCLMLQVGGFYALGSWLVQPHQNSNKTLSMTRRDILRFVYSIKQVRIWLVKRSSFDIGRLFAFRWMRFSSKFISIFAYNMFIPYIYPLTLIGCQCHEQKVSLVVFVVSHRVWY